jgi:raffinose/stachyose/melibiose transport system substrate-binding protein
MEQYVANKQIVDLTPYFNKNNLKDKWLPSALAQATYQGKIWGVPVENVAIAMVFYNKAMYAKYGLKVPTTLKELEHNCDVLKSHGIIPFACANSTSWTGDIYYQFLATRYGGTKPFQDALHGIGDKGFTADNFIKAGEKIQEWVKKGYFNKGVNSLSEDSGQSRQLLYQNKACMYVMGTWAVSAIQSENPAFYKEMGLFNFPGIQGAAVNPNTVVGTVGDNFYHIASTCKYPQQAFDMICHLLDDTAVAARIKNGRIPPLKGLKFDNPASQQIMDTLNKAPDLQFWYDQSSAPAVSQVHLQGSQELFGLSITPEKACQEWEQAQKDFLAGTK